MHLTVHTPHCTYKAVTKQKGAELGCGLVVECLPRFLGSFPAPSKRKMRERQVLTSLRIHFRQTKMEKKKNSSRQEAKAPLDTSNQGSAGHQ